MGLVSGPLCLAFLFVIADSDGLLALTQFASNLDQSWVL